MKIETIAIWANNLEEMKNFYCKYFHGTTNEKYTESETGFESYFIKFDKGAKLEIMKIKDINKTLEKEVIGIAHIAFNVSGKEKVNNLTETLKIHGYTVLGEPRVTGDGYYESIILDPEGNRIELVA